MIQKGNHKGRFSFKKGENRPSLELFTDKGKT